MLASPRHLTNVFSAAVAGGGIQGGRVIGSSDAKGGKPASHPKTPQDVLATIYRPIELTISEIPRSKASGLVAHRNGQVARSVSFCQALRINALALNSLKKMCDFAWSFKGNLCVPPSTDHK